MQVQSRKVHRTDNLLLDDVVEGRSVRMNLHYSLRCFRGTDVFSVLFSLINEDQCKKQFDEKRRFLKILDDKSGGLPRVISPVRPVYYATFRANKLVYNEEKGEQTYYTSTCPWKENVCCSSANSMPAPDAFPKQLFEQ